MLRTGLLLVALALSVSAGDLPKKVYKKIAQHQLMASCWGEKNMLKYYVAAHEATEECMQLSPAFDLDLFDNNPTPFGASGPGFGGNFQTLPAQIPTNFLRPNTPQPQPADFNRFLQFMYTQFQRQQGNRFRRAVETPSAEDIQEFAESLADFKDMMKDNIGNLTCVLAKLGALDKNLQINLRHFTQDAWDEVTGVDPMLKSKAIQCYEDCYSLSQSVPQAILDKKPILKQFGRHMFFFKCIGKMEKKLCAQKELSGWLEAWYGPQDPALMSRLGLPTDKYEAAPIIMKVLEHQKPEAAKFVAKALFHMDE